MRKQFTGSWLASIELQGLTGRMARGQRIDNYHYASSAVKLLPLK